MTNMGYDASTETADTILREVDFGRKGAIEFQDYLDVSSFLLTAQEGHTDSRLDRRWPQRIATRIRVHASSSDGNDERSSQGRCDRAARR